MATLNQNQDEEQNPNQPNQPTTAGTSSPTGSGTGVGVGTAQASQVKQNQAPTNNAGYTDVASYLNANQGGGEQIGNQVASNLTGKYNTTKSGIDTSANQANQQVQSGYIPENTQLIQQVASNPNAAANDAGQLSAFQGQLNDTYGGPANWADYGTQQGNVNEASQYGNLLNAPGGKNVLVQDVENKLNPGQTSQGINSLDTLLFGGNPNAVNTAKTAAAPLNTLNDYINSQNTAIGQNITGAQNAAAQTSQNALNAFTGDNGTLTNLNNTINQNTASQLTGAQQQEQAVRDALSNIYSNGNIANNELGIQNYNVGSLSPEIAASLGMNPEQAAQFQQALQNAGTSQYKTGHNFGASSQTGKSDLLSFLNQQDPTQMITNATTATPEQYQQMAAIQKLLGSKTPQNMAINPLNASQAGTYSPGQLNNFDFAQATSGANQFATDAQKAAQDQANSLTAAADKAHAESQHNHGVLGALKQDFSNPEHILNSIGSVINPLSWGSNIQNLVNGKQVNAGAINPLNPEQSIETPSKTTHPVARAYGGEIPDYLDKHKEVK